MPINKEKKNIIRPTHLILNFTCMGEVVIPHANLKSYTYTCYLFLCDPVRRVKKVLKIVRNEKRNHG